MTTFAQTYTNKCLSLINSVNVNKHKNYFGRKPFHRTFHLVEFTTDRGKYLDSRVQNDSVLLDTQVASRTEYANSKYT